MDHVRISRDYTPAICRNMSRSRAHETAVCIAREDGAVGILLRKGWNGTKNVIFEYASIFPGCID